MPACFVLVDERKDARRKFTAIAINFDKITDASFDRDRKDREGFHIDLLLENHVIRALGAIRTFSRAGDSGIAFKACTQPSPENRSGKLRFSGIRDRYIQRN